MNGFRFRLDRVLDLRRTEMERAEAQLRREAAQATELDRARAEVEAAGIRAELEVRAWDPVTGSDLAALGGYRLAIERRERELDAQRAQARMRLAAGRDAVMEARRRCRLLERLKERQLAEWQAARDRELETLAAESHLARWTREKPR